MKKRMHEQNKKFDKEIATIKNPKQTESLELRNTINELKNLIESVKSRLSHAEERISNLEDRTLEITSSEEQQQQKESTE